MEALAAIALAGNISQFLEQGVGVLRQARRMRAGAAGAPGLILDLEEQAKALDALSEFGKDIAKLSADSPEAVAVLEISERCRGAVDDMVGKVNGIKVDDPNSRRQALRAALKTKLKEHELKAAEDKLDRLAVEFRSRLSSFNWALMQSQVEKLANKQLDLGISFERILALIESVQEDARVIKESALQNWSQDALSNLLQASVLSTKACKTIREERILERICFPEIDSRFKSVPEAHEGTCDWIFDVSAQSGSCPGPTSLTDWLAKMSGVFHLDGRLGSGKSVMMKFLYDHARTQRELEAWADGLGKKLITAKYFFWRFGAAVEQHSLRGMIQSLLYEVLMRQPDLIPLVLPCMWGEALQETWHDHVTRRLRMASPKDIESAWSRIVDERMIYDRYCICLFVDGLDEQDEKGSDVDSLDLMRKLAAWTHNSGGFLKICTASRPDLVFVQHLGHWPTVHVHDDNGSALRTYVNSRLVDLAHISADKHDKLVDSVITRARGIFIYCVFATNYLRTKSYGEKVDDLVSDIDTLPRDLRDIMERLLDSIPEPDRMTAYLTFQIMLALKDQEIATFSLASWSLLYSGRHKKLPSVEHYLSNANQPLADTMEWTQFLETARQRLMTVCRGLVESEDALVNSKPRPMRYYFESSTYPILIFTHRSVPEFLAEGIHTLRQEELVATEEYYIDLFCSLMLAEVGNFRPTRDNQDDLSSLFWKLMLLRERYDLDRCAPFKVLDSMEQMAGARGFSLEQGFHVDTSNISSQAWRPGILGVNFGPSLHPTSILSDRHWRPWKLLLRRFDHQSRYLGEKPDVLSPILFSIKTERYTYVAHRVGHSSTAVDLKTGMAVITLVLHQGLLRGHDGALEILRLLFSLGFDPNSNGILLSSTEMPALTSWTWFLGYLIVGEDGGDFINGYGDVKKMQATRALAMFLENGAEPDVSISCKDGMMILYPSNVLDEVYLALYQRLPFNRGLEEFILRQQEERITLRELILFRNLPGTDSLLEVFDRKLREKRTREPVSQARKPRARRTGFLFAAVGVAAAVALALLIQWWKML